MKTIFAAMLAASFLISVPSIVRAEDKAPAADSAKGKKADKGDKAAKGAKKDDAAKSGGGW